jgi:transposase InsO family protein
MRCVPVVQQEVRNCVAQNLSRTGIPKQIVSDNGPQFTSGEFENFTKQNGIKHYKSAPFHPATNGLVERFVQTFKNSMRGDTGSPEPLVPL